MWENPKASHAAAGNVKRCRLENSMAALLKKLNIVAI